MTHSVVQQYIHVMWSTQNQKYHITPQVRNEIYRYITTVIASYGGYVYSIGGVSDHIHILMSLDPDMCISILMNKLKVATSKLLKTKTDIDPTFAWQKGYNAFGTQYDKIDNVCAYIKSDEVRHRSKTFVDELNTMLKMQNVSYDEKYYLDNTHCKIHVHAIWSTYKRIPSMIKTVRTELFNKIKEVVKNSKGSTLAIGGIEDHVHLLFEAPRDKPLSELIKEIKTVTTHWMKSYDFSNFNDFEWQVGFGAFSVSYSGLDAITNYVENQEEHHFKQTTKGEWEQFFNSFGYVAPNGA